MLKKTMLKTAAIFIAVMMAAGLMSVSWSGQKAVYAEELSDTDELSPVSDEELPGSDDQLSSFSTMAAVTEVEVSATSEFVPEETYLILSADLTKAISSDAGNQWGSANAAVGVSVSEDGTSISSDSDLSKCLWTYDEDGYLCNQQTVYLNYMNGGPFLKPSGEPSTAWTYSFDNNLLTSGAYSVGYDPSNLYFNGKLTEQAGSAGKTYLYKVTDETGGGEHEHSYTPIVTEPTCTEGGYTTYICSCGESYTDDITEPLGHDWTDWTYDTSSSEYQHYRSCKRVNDGYKCDAYDEAACEYAFLEKVEATCGTRGYTAIKCTGCGHIVRDYVDATGEHSYVAKSRNNGKGYHDLTCSVCKQSTLEACTWDEGKVTKEATDTQSGIITYTCTVCGDTKEDIIPAGGGFETDESGNYLITNASELEALAELVNEGSVKYSSASYLLTNDIKLIGKWTPIGEGTFAGANVFKGIFDGGNHTISGLEISGFDTEGCYGLFGVVGGTKDEPAVIKNLSVRGSISNISTGSTGSSSSAGGIVGATNGNLEIENCASHVTVENSFSYATGSYNTGIVESYIGGLIGYAFSNEYGNTLFINNCYADGNIKNENINSTYAGYSRAYAGGLIGGTYHYFGWASMKNVFVNMDDITVSNTMYAKDEDGSVFVYGDVILGYDGGSTTGIENIYYPSGLAYSRASDSQLYTVASRNVPNAKAQAITTSLEGLGTLKYTSDGKVIFEWETEPEETPVTAGKYELSRWIWSEDYSTASAEFINTEGETDVQTVDAVVSSVTDKEATCEKNGKKINTATVVFNDVQFSDNKAVTIPATGHDWGEGTVTKEATHSEPGTIEYTCKNDSSHKKTEQIPATGSIVKIKAQPVSELMNGKTYIILSNAGGSLAMSSIVKASYEDGHDYNYLTPVKVKIKEDTAVFDSVEEADASLFTAYENENISGRFAFFNDGAWLRKNLFQIEMSGNKDDASYLVYNGLALTEPYQGAYSYVTYYNNVYRGWTQSTYIIRAYEVVTDENTYTVNFDSNGGSRVEPASVQAGSPVAKPSDPSREEYTFEGWYADKELATPWDFNMPVTETITLYAKWSPASGESLSLDVQKVLKIEVGKQYIFTDNGRTLAMSSAKGTGNFNNVLAGRAISFSEDGKKITFGSLEDKRTAVWNSESADSAQEIKLGMNGSYLGTGEGSAVYPAGEEENVAFSMTDGYLKAADTGNAIGYDIVWKGFRPDINAVSPVCVYEIVSEDHEHTHVTMKKDEVPASCEDAGQKAYWICTECGEMFGDENAEQLILRPETISAKGHDYGQWEQSDNELHARICKNDPSHIETAPHSWDEGKVTKEATINENGIRTYTCTVCGGTKDVSFEFVCRHDLKHVEKVEPLCEKEGSEAYYVCNVCGRFYADASAMEEIEKDSWILPAKGHSWDKGTVTTEPSCTEPGEITYTCRNDSSHTKTEAVPAAGHSYRLTESIEATCTEEGYDVYTCSVCGVTEKRNVKPAAGHSPFAPVKENETAATCTSEGSYDEVVYCSACSAELSRETKKVDKLAHMLAETAAKEATCENAGNTAYWICSECGKIFADSEGRSEISKEETVIPAIGHDWDDGIWTWTEDRSSADIIFTCRNDSSHTQKIAATVTKDQTKAPSKDAEGEMNYTATVSFGGKTYTDTVKEVIPKLDDEDPTAPDNPGGDDPTNPDNPGGDDPGKQDESQTVAVSSIKLSPESAVMPTSSAEKDSKLKITAVVTPDNATNKKLSWKSSNDAVAEVDAEGNVRALSYGTAVITATDSSGKVKGSCTVNVKFNDVNGTNIKGAAGYQYYYDAVYWAADNGITKGYGRTLSDGTKVADSAYFGPERNCQRREMVIFLWRLAGSPVKNSKGNAYGDARNYFNDLKSYGTNTATNKAIAWGYKEGIVKGYSDGGFHPTASIVRKDTMIMLYRLADKPAVSGKTGFSDVDGVYKTNTDTYRAILWGSKKGITYGYDSGPYKGKFGTMLDCLREHIVTFIYRYSK